MSIILYGIKGSLKFYDPHFLYYRFISYRSVRDAEEAISNTDNFDFGFEKNLRVRLSHGKKDDGFGNFIPQNIDVKLGDDYKPNVEESSDRVIKDIDSGNVSSEK